MEVYLHTFSTSIFQAQEISFMLRPLYPSRKSPLYPSLPQHCRTQMSCSCQETNPDSSAVRGRRRHTKNTVCCRTLLQGACGAGTGQPRAGTHSWTRPLDWGHLTLPTTLFIPSARCTVQSFGKDFCSATPHQFIDTPDCDECQHKTSVRRRESCDTRHGHKIV
jgi:hypothetical protein